MDTFNWSEFPLKHSGHRDGSSGNTGGPRFSTNTALAVYFVYSDLCEFRELPSEEAHKSCDAPWHVPEEHPVGYVNSDDYCRAYGGDDAIVDNESEESGVVVVHDTSARAKDSLEEVPPAEPAVIPSTASAGLSVPSGVTAIENEIIARFLQIAGLSSAEVSEEVTALADVLAYRLAGGQTPAGWEK